MPKAIADLAKLTLPHLKTLNIVHGSHTDRTNGLCVMEAVAWVAGEKHSDHPECTCPVITEFMVRWNDGLPSDADRNRLLRPIVRKLVGTRGNDKLATRRRFMIVDWQVREALPLALNMVESLKPIAEQLKALPEIKTWDDFDKATALIQEARTKSAAAWAAAWDAARAAAWDAARDAARDAAWDAALN